MNERPSEINDQNVLTADIESIAQDRRFDELKFENAKDKLSKVQKWLVEAKELNFEKLLISEDITRISDIKNQLIKYLQDLLTFDNRTTRENAKQEHDSLENQVEKYYNGAYQHIAMRILPFLRQEVARSSEDAKELEKRQKSASQAEKKYKELSEKLETRFQELDQQEKELDEKKKQVESGHGELAAVRLTKHFQGEADNYAELSNNWLKIRSKFYWGIIIIILILAAIYFYVGWEKISLQLGVAKIIFLSALWYGLAFATRNYNINSHLAAVNRHRAAVARTLEDFLESNPERKSEMLKNATEAMFKHAPIGFVTKAEKDSGNPLFEIINKIINPRDGQ
ncbi:hypothetical protein HYV91_01985 [Candidatus Wolfebacteria bacterium]|nr:hypothetical protein [Candidatus Wolfebacteria bacterium]